MIERFDDGSGEVIGALIEVHRELGPELLESAYEACFCRELQIRGLRFERQKALPIEYKGTTLDCEYRIDVLVEDRLLVELKSVDQLLPVHAAQALTYMKLANVPVGLLVNFNVVSLRLGLRRFSIPPKSHF